MARYTDSGCYFVMAIDESKFIDFLVGSGYVPNEVADGRLKLYETYLYEDDYGNDYSQYSMHIGYKDTNPDTEGYLALDLQFSNEGGELTLNEVVRAEGDLMREDEQIIDTNKVLGRFGGSGEAVAKALGEYIKSLLERENRG